MSTYIEIMAQIEALQKQAEEARQREVGMVIADIREKIEAYHLTAADLGLVAAPAVIKEEPAESAKRSTVKPKYRNPETGKTWTGRGVQPLWMKAAIDAGHSKEDFLIPEDEAAQL